MTLRFATALVLLCALGCSRSHKPQLTSRADAGHNDAGTRVDADAAVARAQRDAAALGHSSDGYLCLGGANPFLGIVPDPSYDYGALYSAETTTAGVDPDGGGPAWYPITHLVAQAGFPCMHARDATGCSERLFLLSGAGDVCSGAQQCGHFLVTTRADDVARSSERSALIAFLGAIDSPSKAALVAAFDGYEISCWPGLDSEEGTRANADADGYTLRLSWHDCQGTYTQVVHVNAQGQLVAEERVETARSSCTQ